MTHDELQREAALLASVADGTYPHGLDLRPLASLIADRMIGLAVDHGRVRIHLLDRGKKRLASARRFLGGSFVAPPGIPHGAP